MIFAAVKHCNSLFLKVLSSYQDHCLDKLARRPEGVRCTTKMGLGIKWTPQHELTLMAFKVLTKLRYGDIALKFRTFIPGCTANSHDLQMRIHRSTKYTNGLRLLAHPYADKLKKKEPLEGDFYFNVFAIISMVDEDDLNEFGIHYQVTMGFLPDDLIRAADGQSIFPYEYFIGHFREHGNQSSGPLPRPTMEAEPKKRPESPKWVPDNPLLHLQMGAILDAQLPWDQFYQQVNMDTVAGHSAAPYAHVYLPQMEVIPQDIQCWAGEQPDVCVDPSWQADQGVKEEAMDFEDMQRLQQFIAQTPTKPAVGYPPR